MKKIAEVLSIALLSLGTIYLIVGTFAKNGSSELAQSFNQYNLLAKRGPQFAKIDNSYDSTAEDEDGNYTYYLDGFDRQGNPREVEFSTPKKLKQNQYVKLDAQGSHIKGYEIITRDGMPYKVYSELKTF